MAAIKAERIVTALGGPVSVTLLTLNVVVFVCIHLCVWCGVDDRTAATALSLPSDFAGLVSHPWTLLTYMFTQWDGLHLLVNMLWLASFAPIFYRIGLPTLTWRVYLAGGFGGAAAFIITAMYTSVPEMLAGASAAVMGIVAAAAVYRPHARLSLPGFGEVPLVVIAIIVGALYIIASLGTPGTCAAHLGGALGGGLYAFAEKRIRRYKARRRIPHAAHNAQRPISQDQMHAELDQILTKVGRSGYGSLNDAERRRLFEISQRLK